VADDATALYYNPAGLVQLDRPEAAFTLIEYPVGLKFVFVGGATPFPMTRGVIGIHATSLFTDEMIETTPDRPYGTGRTFTAGDLAAGVSYCQRLTDKFSAGANLKFLNETLAEVSANGWAADFGTFYTTGWRRINIGMVIQNFGPDMKFESSPFPLPITFKFGASAAVLDKRDYSLLVAGEFVHPNDNVEEYHLGVELRVMRMINFRLGKKVNGWIRDTWEEYTLDSQKDPFIEFPLLERQPGGGTIVSLDGFSAGVGVIIPEAGVNVDYAFGALGTLGGVHRISVGYKFARTFF
jgi:hypothetical protein